MEIRFRGFDMQLASRVFEVEFDTCGWLENRRRRGNGAVEAARKRAGGAQLLRGLTPVRELVGCGKALRPEQDNQKRGAEELNPS